MWFLLSGLLAPAHAGDFIDVWVTTALEDDNVFAGPEGRSPGANFVMRGNSTFFENYESRTTDDLSRANLVLYRADEPSERNWATEAAFVLRFTPYLDPDNTDPGTDISDDGSYIRIIKVLPGDDHNLSLTGYAIDAGRFRLGYSYDLTWGGTSIFSFDPGAAPGVRLQWQKGGAYAMAGMKSAIGDTFIAETNETWNQAYYGFLGGAGVTIADRIKVEGGVGMFQQDQLKAVKSTTSDLYGEIIDAMGICGQISWRSRTDLGFPSSADLRLVRNSPDFMRDTYISHPNIDGLGLILLAEANSLSHALLDPVSSDSLVVERGLAGDVQAIVVAGTTELRVDMVYKDLAYILFDVPGLTSGVAMSDDMPATAQLYGRMGISHYFPNLHFAPSIGAGLMQPATYETSDGGVFVQYSDTDKEKVPDGQEPAAVLSAVAGTQIDVSKSVVVVGEILYTVDNNLSRSQAIEGGDGELERVPAPDNERQALGFNLMMRARF